MVSSHTRKTYFGSILFFVVQCSWEIRMLCGVYWKRYVHSETFIWSRGVGV
jgi:hypothetical protein